MQSPSIQLGRRRVGPGSKPYLIAEIGVNHGSDLDLAKSLIELAKEGGADAAKFQTYKSDRLAAKHSPAYWDLNEEPTTNQRELFAKYDGFGPEEYQALAEHCRTVDIDFLSTPFDLEAVDLLDPVAPFFKIASADITNIPLLRRVASKGKPVLQSTGASSLAEVDIAYRTLTAAGCKDIILLQCTLNYPCPDENANLNMIEGLAHAFPTCVVGYSDHTIPDEEMTVLTAAWLKGAVVIEKHFTHDKSLVGNDHYHAMNADDCKRFIANVERLDKVLGQTFKAPLPDEAQAREHARRSIVTDGALKAGDVLREDMITTKRPAHGIPPLHWDEVIGRKLAVDLDDDIPLQWQHLA